MTKKKFDCAKGCFSCCLIRAHVTGAEKDKVLKALREMPNQDVARERAEHRSKMDFTLAAGLAPCVALGPDGNCQIYESRPETCRTYYSTDKRECEKAATGQKYDRSTIHKDERTPDLQLAYIDELYLAQVKGESTEIRPFSAYINTADELLYIDVADGAAINPVVREFADSLPKQLGAVLFFSADQKQCISVTLYSRQIQIEI